MAGFNRSFELTPQDLELIEDALRRSKSELSAQMLDGTAQHDKARDRHDETDGTMRRIHDLLGRLHNQKVFYRPRRGAYVGG